MKKPLKLYIVAKRCQLQAHGKTLPLPDGAVAIYPVFKNKKTARAFAGKDGNIIEVEETPK
jgi:hypothetical protein